MKETVRAHLRSRGVDLEKTRVTINEEKRNATFYLYNLSGQLVGFQQYTPAADKTRGTEARRFYKEAKADINFRDMMKYFTFAGEEGKEKKHAVWGLETLGSENYVFLTEGIFDAVKIHNSGHPAVAVLANSPKPLRGWLRSLGRTVIAILDNDDAGVKLRNVAHLSYTTPDPWKDLGEMPQSSVNAFMDAIMTGGRLRPHS